MVCKTGETTRTATGESATARRSDANSAEAVTEGRMPGNAKAIQSWLRDVWNRAKNSPTFKHIKTKPLMAGVTFAMTIVTATIAVVTFRASLPDLVVTVETIGWDNGIDESLILEHIHRIQRRYPDIVGESLYRLEDLASELRYNRLSGAGAGYEFNLELGARMTQFAENQRLSTELSRLDEELENMYYSADWLSAAVHIQNRSVLPNAIQPIALLRVYGCDNQATSNTPMYLQGDNGRLDGYDGRRFEFRSPYTIDYIGCRLDEGAVFALGIRGTHERIWIAVWSPGMDGPVWPEPEDESELEAALDEYIENRSRNSEVDGRQGQ